jgi:hypothetical protein
MSDSPIFLVRAVVTLDPRCTVTRFMRTFKGAASAVMLENQEILDDASCRYRGRWLAIDLAQLVHHGRWIQEACAKLRQICAYLTPPHAAESMRRVLRSLRRNYLEIDPRTLGLARIAIAGLLLIDLAKRATALSIFYTNRGLIPNHTMLWRPIRRYTLSFLFALSERHEVQIAVALIALVYLCFLVGYRTRLMHALSWMCLISLEIRVDILSNGADFVFSDLVLWTAFLPLGKRFSLDALLASFRARDADLEGLRRFQQTPRDSRPIVSLAVLAAITQLAVIYVFNAISKRGHTWHDGSAVYWMVHQERIVTWLGLFAREHLPYAFFQGLTYMTIAVEGALPLLMMSPWGRPWTRRAAIALVFALHAGIAMMANLGLFSPIMMAFSLLLVSAQDWEWLEQWAHARPKRHVRLYVRSDSGLSFLLARALVRFDLFRRIELQPMAAQTALLMVESARGTCRELEPALRRLCRVLPAGVLWVGIVHLCRPLTGPLLRWVERNPERVEAALGLSPPTAAESRASHADAPAHTALRAFGRALAELGAAALLIVATSQTIEENRSIPSWLKQHQPKVIAAAVNYFRLNQGWSMFAPDAPMQDQTIIVDAVTVDGRHVDPLNEVASRVSDPTLRRMPVRLAQAAVFCDYISHIADHDELQEPLRQWILNYHHRTRRAQDRVVHFKAYDVEHDSPAPGESEPRNVTAHVFLRD